MGAKQIGGLRHPSDSKTQPISWIEHKFLHGILGAGLGMALSKDRMLGALSGGFGAIASETIAEQITPSPEDLYQGIIEDHRKRGIVLTERGLQKSYTQAIQLRADISRMTSATLLFLAKGDITVGDITGSNALQNNFSSTFASEFGKYAYQYGEDHPEEMEKLNKKISEVEEKIEETLSTEVEFFSHQKKNNLSRIDKNLNILSEENQQKYPLPNYAKENWAQLRKYQQDMRVIEENRTTTVGGLSGEVLLEGGLLFLPTGRVANWVGTGLKGAKEILIKTLYGKELINFSKPFVEKGVQLFQKAKNWVFPSVNNAGMTSVKNFMPHQIGPPSNTFNALDLPEIKILRGMDENVPKEMTSSLTTYRGGLYGRLDRLPGIERHHMPANSVTDIPRAKGPAIQMDSKDHFLTSSYGNSKSAQKYREEIRELINKKQFRRAMLREIKDVRNVTGKKYNKAILEMLEKAKQEDLLKKDL